MVSLVRKKKKKNTILTLIDRPGSFILSATNTQHKECNNISSFEQYFYKGPRLFSFLPQKEDLTSHSINDHLQKWLDFKSLYQKTRALVKESGKFFFILFFFFFYAFPLDSDLFI